MNRLAVAALALLTLGAGPIEFPKDKIQWGPAAAPVRQEVRLEPTALIYRQMEGRFLKGPRGVWVDPRRGEVYVADTMNDLVAVFDANGVPLFAFGYNGEFKEPIKAVADDEDRIYVLAGIGNKIRVFNYRGEYLSDFPFRDLDVVATALTADDKGNLYIADAKSSQVLVYDSAYSLKRRIGETVESVGANGRGRLRAIQALVVDADGTVYVACAQGVPIQVFSAEGKFLRGWGEHAAGPNNFSLPSGIALDPEGRLVIVDTIRQAISMFTKDGVFIGREGGLGYAAGTVAFPTDVATDAAGRMYVTERVNNRLQILEQRTVAAGRGAPNGAPRASDRAREDIKRSLGDFMRNAQ